MRPTDRRGFLRLLGLGSLAVAALPHAAATGGDGPREDVLSTSHAGLPSPSAPVTELWKSGAFVPVSREVLEDAPDLHRWLAVETGRRLATDEDFRTVSG